MKRKVAEGNSILDTYDCKGSAIGSHLNTRQEVAVLMVS